MSKKYKSSKDMSTGALCIWLDELSDASANDNFSEFAMRIPAQCDRDPDIVLAAAAARLRSLESDKETLEIFASLLVDENEGCIVTEEMLQIVMAKACKRTGRADIIDVPEDSDNNC